jgi:hypothetical protein
MPSRPWWRGSFTPTIAGEWSISMTNFPTVAPIRIVVTEAEAMPDAVVAAGASLLVGLLGGLLIGRVASRPRSRVT